MACNPKCKYASACFNDCQYKKCSAFRLDDETLIAVGNLLSAIHKMLVIKDTCVKPDIQDMLSEAIMSNIICLHTILNLTEPDKTTEYILTHGLNYNGNTNVFINTMINNI